MHTFFCIFFGWCIFKKILQYYSFNISLLKSCYKHIIPSKRNEIPWGGKKRGEGGRRREGQEEWVGEFETAYSSCTLFFQGQESFLLHTHSLFLITQGGLYLSFETWLSPRLILIVCERRFPLIFFFSFLLLILFFTSDWLLLLIVLAFFKRYLRCYIVFFLASKCNTWCCRDMACRNLLVF